MDIYLKVTVRAQMCCFIWYFTLIILFILFFYAWVHWVGWVVFWLFQSYTYAVYFSEIICCFFFLFFRFIFYSPLFIFVDFSSDSSQNLPLTVSNELLSFSCYFLTPEVLLFTIFYFQSFIYFSIILYYINMPMMGTLQKLELSSGGWGPCSTGFPPTRWVF